MTQMFFFAAVDVIRRTYQFVEYNSIVTMHRYLNIYFHIFSRFSLFLYLAR